MATEKRHSQEFDLDRTDKLPVLVGASLDAEIADDAVPLESARATRAQHLRYADDLDEDTELTPMLPAEAAAGTAAAPLATPSSAGEADSPLESQACISLDGTWEFRTDPQNSGELQGWQQQSAAAGWRSVTVPHTWQVEPEYAEYMGAGWYRRAFEAPRAWMDRAVRVEFEAVFHSATVWLNGVEIGRHTGHLLGLPPTGRETVTTGIDMLRIVGGKIAEGWVSWDTLGLFEQLMDLGEGTGSGFLSLLERFQAP